MCCELSARTWGPGGGEWCARSATCSDVVGFLLCAVSGGALLVRRVPHRLVTMLLVVLSAGRLSPFARCATQPSSPRDVRVGCGVWFACRSQMSGLCNLTRPSTPFLGSPPCPRVASQCLRDGLRWGCPAGRSQSLAIGTDQKYAKRISQGSLRHKQGRPDRIARMTKRWRCGNVTDAVWVAPEFMLGNQTSGPTCRHHRARGEC